MGGAPGRGGFSFEVRWMWTSDYDCKKISGKEYERNKEDNLGGCLLFISKGY